MHNHSDLQQDVSSIRRTVLTLLRWLVVATLTGIACGLVGSAFYHAITYVTALRQSHDWLLLCMPLAGLLIVWMYQSAGMSNDSGTNQIISSVRSSTRPPLRLLPLISISTVLTHLVGGSAGREGAALQIGGSIGAPLGKLLHLGEKNTNLIIMCGMSAVFTALFGTPLTATVFSLEVVSIGILHYSALFPCFLSSIVAFGVSQLLGVVPTAFPLLGAPALGMESMLRVGGLAVLCALLSIAFCVVMHRSGSLYKRLFPNPWLRVLVGSGLVLLVTFLSGSRDYNGAGGEVIARALSGQAVPYAFALKLLLTALTLGAGFRGGEIVPTFFIGSTFGCVFGGLLGLDPAFGAAIGLVSLFCGVVNCPLASIVLSVELFGCDNLLFFAMACALSYLLSGRFSLYSSQKLIYSKLEPTFIDASAR